MAGHERDLEPTPAVGAATQEGTWTCDLVGYPSISRTTLHPCSSFIGECCRQDVTPVGLRYVSSSHTPEVHLEVTYEVWPNCGDGLVVTLEVVHSNFTEPVFTHEYEPGMKAAKRQFLEQEVLLAPSSAVRLLVHPRDNHDCDAVQLHDFKVWRG